LTSSSSSPESGDDGGDDDDDDDDGLEPQLYKINYPCFYTTLISSVFVNVNFSANVNHRFIQLITAEPVVRCVDSKMSIQRF